MFLEHVNLTVTDLERSIAFYARLFDFKVRWRGETSDGKAAAHVGDDQDYLALFQARAATPRPREEDYDAVGFNHFGFVVDDLDDLKRRLDAMGVAIRSEQRYDPGRHLYFRDPDGFEIEAVQYASGESRVSAETAAT